MSVTLSTPEIRAAVQDGFLVRRILHGLLPRLMWRAEASEPESWEGAAGEKRTFTAKGHSRPSGKALVPGNDPKVIQRAPKEQWEAELKVYPDEGAQTVHTVTAVNAIVNLLYDEIHTLGIQAGLSMNVISRAPIMNAALAGWTVVDGTQAAVTTLRVARLNGFTRARRPDLAGASLVKYNPVSTTNPLKVTVNGTANEVIGYTPDYTDDEYGPGTVTLKNAVTVTDRDVVKADDATYIHRVGTGNSGSIDVVTPANVLRFADIRTAVTRFRRQDISNAKFDDGFWHLHIDPTPMSQLFGDPEFQRLTDTGLAQVPDFFLFIEQVQRVALGCVFLENNRTWTAGNDNAYGSETAGGPRATYSEQDPVGGETNRGGVPTGDAVHHTVILAAGMLKEYYQNQDMYVTDAGVTGLLGDFESELSNDEVMIRTQGIKFIMQAAKNLHADQVNMAWKWVGAFSVRPDGVVGDAARYKRVLTIQSGA